MKQVILILAILLLTVGKTFAADPVSSAVEKAFRSSFSNAVDVSWSESKGFTIASFIQKGKKKVAYFNQAAELVVVVESVNQLTEEQQQGLEESYSDYQLVEAYKLKNEEGTKLFVVLENKKETLILTYTSVGWEQFSKTKK